MPKSIFGKLLFVNIIIIIITLTVTGFLLSGFVSNYIISDKEKMLTENSKRVASLTAYAKESSRSFDIFYSMNIDAISASLDSFIIVTDTQGNIIASTNSQLTGNLDTSLYQEVLEGRDVVYRDTNLNGLFTENVFTSCTPVKSNNKVIGAVLLSIATPNMNRIGNYVTYIFTVSGVFVIFLAFALLYYVSMRMTRPIKQINKVAKIIASGEFQNRVTVDTNDEVGQLANTFNNMAESLEHLENMRRSFIANVSHELRTPMTTISGFVEGILDGTVPYERQREYLTIVLEESKRLSKLVNSILDLAKMEGSDTAIDPKPFSITELLRINIVKLEKRIKEKNISVYIEFGNDNVTVLADRDAISQVVTNLLDNAVKFANEGGKIEIDVKTKDDKAYVSILNSGIGIAQNEMKFIWERFYKTDKSRSIDKSGAGLGLFIVKSLITKHGEKIWAESEPGSFTKFVFTLKLV